MKIALISYEYPPDTADGGIATYVGQAARMLHERGHHVEIFAGSRDGEGSVEQNGIRVHRVVPPDLFGFAVSIAPVFAQRHERIGFEVMEGAEYKADAREAAHRAPEVPLVVKLHTPTYLGQRLSTSSPTPIESLRRLGGALRRRGRRTWIETEEAVERAHALEADLITAPCRAIAQEVAGEWRLDLAAIAQVPNPYTPSPALLAIPAATCSGVVSFIGRLEQRKGVLDLARAVPLVLKRHPKARFRFVGRSMSSPRSGVDMRRYLQEILGPANSAVEWVDQVPPSQVPSLLAASDVCVFPSLWENFPNVCLEAMAAARGVIGSSSGGMAEQLDEGRAGRLIEPGQPQQIAEAICEFLDDPAGRAALGCAARERVLQQYNAERIGQLQEAAYERAIATRRRLGPRLKHPSSSFN